MEKENYGDLEKLKELGKNKKHSFTTEQLLNKDLKNENGESRKEVSERIENGFKRVFNENLGKRIVIVSHGACLKFLLMNWCELNKENKLEFNKKTFKLNSPGIIKLTFENEELIELNQIF